VTFQVSLVDDISHRLQVQVIVMLIPHCGANVAMAHRIHDELQVFRGLIDKRTIRVPRGVKYHGRRQTSSFVGSFAASLP
jgi:hypothetical protein